MHLYKGLFLLVCMLCSSYCAGGRRNLKSQELKNLLAREDIQDVLGKAIDTYNQKQNSMFRYVFHKVLSGTIQVVQGRLYTFDVRLLPTLCGKTDKDLSRPEKECELTDMDFPRVVRLKIWSRPWMNEKNKMLITDMEPLSKKSTHHVTF